MTQEVIRYALTLQAPDATGDANLLEVVTCACGLGSDGTGDNTWAPCRYSDFDGELWLTDWYQYSAMPELRATHQVCLACGLVIPWQGAAQWRHEPFNPERDAAHLLTVPQLKWLGRRAVVEFGTQTPRPLIYLIPAYSYAERWNVPLDLDPSFRPVWARGNSWPYSAISFDVNHQYGEVQTEPYDFMNIKGA